MNTELTVEEILQHFENWLHTRYRLNSVRNIITAAVSLMEWCKEKNINPIQLSYAELLGYIQFCSSNGNGKTTINQKITGLKHFYNYLQLLMIRDENPVEEIRIRNATRKVLGDIIPYETLENLYAAYPLNGVNRQRNKAIIGLMVYQALTTGELEALEVKDLKLEEGKIFIPSVSRSNSRTLKLEAQQLIHLQNYLLKIRPLFMAVSRKQITKLFMSRGKSSKLGNSQFRLINEIRKVNPGIKDLRQIRASVIAHWYKLHHARQVQYMAGHRYVSSTEHYRTNRIETLQEQLEKIHPIQ
ncbi:MAG: tyrosine-type recombinase/integrase [Bacteroidetes bacterium]|nr:tyrosine-type recombinase/integrase [Bacteroidota bacterium]MBN8703783.1 tyrosine-type recombinase/integrase [Bacteroidota bacterium]